MKVCLGAFLKMDSGEPFEGDVEALLGVAFGDFGCLAMNLASFRCIDILTLFGFVVSNLSGL